MNMNAEATTGATNITGTTATGTTNRDGERAPFNHSLFSDDDFPDFSSVARLRSSTRAGIKLREKAELAEASATDTRSTGKIATGIAGTAEKSLSSASNRRPLCAGDKVTSPAGRQLLVADIFVPRSNADKSRTLPSQFRNLSRKVVVFANGSIAPLQDIKAHYRLIA